MNDFVFNAKRPSVNFKATLESGEELDLLYYLPSRDEMLRLLNAEGDNNIKEIFSINDDICKNNIKGKGASEFIEELQANNLVEEFLTNIAEFAKEKKAKKRKN